MNIPFFSKKEHKEFYLGIFLKEDRGIVMVFLKENNQLELVDREKFNYTNSWENLTNDVDEALYKLEKNLDLEIQNTIIFVYSHLVDEKIADIKPVYLQKIKKLTKSLDLKPMGYIECYEAISFYLQKEDKISLNAILIEIDKTQVGIFTFIGGKINSKKVMARTDNIIADLTEGFEEIKKNVILPSRIILYDSDDLNDTATKILSHRWSSDFFIQIPKVDILSEDEVINGLMNIFGEQIKDNASSNQRENFGFIVNQDISEKNVDRESELPKTNYFKIFKEFKDKLLNIFKIKTKQNTFKYNLSGKIFIFIGIFIIIIGLFINEYFFHQAVLTLYLPTQVVEKNVKIDVGYRIASASADFTENINTTGKTEIGDKARGQVTIHNFDDKEKIFSKGTVLQTANLPFVLDADIKVASSTLTADGSAKLPGKNNGTVTASQIGTEGNISKSQRFSIEGLSSATFFAVNDSAFSGGSKKQVQTVSKKDQENLKESIIDKAKNKIPSIKISSDEIIASSLSETDFNKMIFSKEIGEESNKLTLQATVNTTQYLYNKKTFIDKILLLLKPDINKDYNLRNENIIYTVNKISKDDKFLTIDAKIKAKAIINILPDEIKKSVLGKNESKINEILKSRFKIDGYNININEPLPIFKNYLPFFIKNINLKNSSL